MLMATISLGDRRVRSVSTLTLVTADQEPSSRIQRCRQRRSRCRAIRVGLIARAGTGRLLPKHQEAERLTQKAAPSTAWNAK